jgi:hypothetical protein
MYWATWNFSTPSDYKADKGMQPVEITTSDFDGSGKRQPCFILLHEKRCDTEKNCSLLLSRDDLGDAALAKRNSGIIDYTGKERKP